VQVGAEIEEEKLVSALQALVTITMSFVCDERKRLKLTYEIASAGAVSARSGFTRKEIVSLDEDERRRVIGEQRRRRSRDCHPKLVRCCRRYGSMQPVNSQGDCWLTIHQPCGGWSLMADTDADLTAAYQTIAAGHAVELVPVEHRFPSLVGAVV